MLHVTKHGHKCCGTCEHWNGVRVHEDDGHIYSLGNVEAVCRKLVGADGNSVPLTLPSGSACPEWESWNEDLTPSGPPERRSGWVSRAFWPD